MNTYSIEVPVRVVSWHTVRDIPGDTPEEALENLQAQLRGDTVAPWLGWDEEGEVTHEEIEWAQAEVTEA